MDSLLWSAQVALAGVFLFAGFTKIFAYKRQIKMPQTGLPLGFFGLPYQMAVAIALVEIVGALALLVPVHSWPPEILPRLAAAGLALVTIVAGIYHHRCKEPAGPSVVLFLLALFVVIGH